VPAVQACAGYPWSMASTTVCPRLLPRLRRRLRAWILAAGCALASLPALGQALPAPGAPELSPAHWIAAAPDAQALLLDPAQVQAHNARLRRDDASIIDLDALPERLPGSRVRGWIQALSAPPRRTLHDQHGQPLAAAVLDGLQAALALDALPATVRPRWGLVVRRSALRTFPTALRVFSTTDDQDLDRFQESALFPGDAVALLHASADGQWLFVASERYRAWLRAADVAEGSRAEVLGYARREPALVVTGAQVRTAHTPEAAELSSLLLDMGVRLPLLPHPGAQAAVNGQSPLAAHLVQLPRRLEDGRLQLAPALLPLAADVHRGPLPLSRANLLTQAFKFLGERYGWGHDYQARDCSGFVSEVYRSFGLLLPRNTGDQAASPALQALPLPPPGQAGARARALAALEVGDLVFMPGHVMLVVGQQDGGPWVIHDIHGGSWRAADGRLQRQRLNGVVVTPLAALLAEDGTPYADLVTALRRVPRSAP